MSDHGLNRACLLLVTWLSLTSALVLPREVLATPFTLWLVEINGGVVTQGDLTVVRFGEAIEIEASWTLNTPPLEARFVRMELWNNTTRVGTSDNFMETGVVTTRTWVFFLHATDWLTGGPSEYGQVRIYNSATMTSVIFPIQILPEQASIELVSHTCENQTNGRVENLRLAFQLASMQNSSNLFPGLPCEARVLDAIDQTILSTIVNVNELGLLDVVLPAGIILNLEDFDVNIQNVPLNRLEPFSLRFPLSVLVPRNPVSLVLDAIDEINEEIRLSFNLLPSPVFVGMETFPLYFTWEVLEGISMVCSGTVFIIHNEQFFITIPRACIDYLESLLITVRFEGTFFLKGEMFPFHVGDVVDRATTVVCLVNHERILEGKDRDLVFSLSCPSRPYLVSELSIHVSWVMLPSHDVIQEAILVSNVNGSFSVRPPQLVFDRIQDVSLVMHADATLEMKPFEWNMSMAAFFMQDEVEVQVSCNHVRPERGQVLIGSIELVLVPESMSTSILNGQPVLVRVVVPGTMATLVKMVVHLDVHGRALVQLDQGIPGDFTSLSIIIDVNASFLFSQVSFTFNIDIPRFEDGTFANHVPAIMFLGGIPTLVMGIIFFKRRTKSKTLSMKSFTVSIPSG